MPLYCESEYDALLYVARRLTGKRPIDWSAEVIQQHCEEKYGSQERECFGPAKGVPEKQRNVWKARKTRFLSKARNYTVGLGDKGEKVLLKGDLQVLRTKDYDRVLQRFHDNNIHEGARKLRAVVSYNPWT